KFPEGLGLESIRVRSPLTCDSPFGMCARCYGVDMSTGRVAEEGLAGGIIAAQSVGEPGTQLTMRTFHKGGVASRAVVESDIKCAQAGIVKFENLTFADVTDREGVTARVVLKRNGELTVVDEKNRELERYRIPYGARLLVSDGEAVKARTA